MVDPEQGREPVYVRACVHLRTKTQFYRPQDMDQPPGVIADSDVLAYFCDQTQDHIGPDRKTCSPSRCQRARDCFASGVGLA